MYKFVCLLISLFFYGCSLSNSTIIEPTISNEIEDLKIIDKQSFFKSEQAGIFKEKSIPAYFGPSSLLTKDEYLLKSYGEAPLLFANFGVNNYLYILLNVSNEDKAVSLGFKTTEELYSHIYKKFHYGSLNDFEHYILQLHKSGLINKDRVLDHSNILNKRKQIINSIYYPYFEFSNQDKILDSWYLYVNDTKIILKEEEYTPYAFIILLLEDILSSSNSNKVNLNGN